jgi:acetyltransferase
MTIRNLEFLFRPRSVAVIAEPGEPGYYPELVHRNLAAAQFGGRIIHIDVKKSGLFGLPRRARIGSLPEVPDLAFTCTPLEDVPRLVQQLGELGTRAVVVGPTRVRRSADAAARFEAIRDAARPHLVRVLGPGSGGLVMPGIGLNLSVAPVAIGKGSIALVTQSAAVAAAVTDRAAALGIGFSAVIHLGGALDVDLADCLDWLASDPATSAILVQFEQVGNARKFMSAARAAARNKPVVAIRSGRTGGPLPPDAARMRDAIYDAALRRAGWIRIETLDGLFGAVEALAHARVPRGPRLAVLSNGSGLGRIAADVLAREGGTLATLEQKGLDQLGRLLHPNASLRNPLILPADATPEQWGQAAQVMLADPKADAVLTVYAPTAFGNADRVAAAIGEAAAGGDRNVLTCWLGGDSMAEARRAAAAAGLLTFDAPERAVTVFQRLVAYARNRALLEEMPPSQATGLVVDEAAARSAIAETMASNELQMPARLASRLVRAYGIRMREATVVASIEHAVEAAETIGYPVELELALVATEAADLSARGLRSAADLRIAARELRSRARAEHPAQRISGYRLRPGEPHGELPPLRLQLFEDPLFGPVIRLGTSADLPKAVERGAVALPPLNRELALDLVQRAAIDGELPPADRSVLYEAVADASVALSQLATDLDEVAAVDIDPLHVEAGGALALAASVRLQRRGRHRGYRRFAIHPYPRELEHEFEWQGRALLVRPIRPEDETTFADLIASLKAEDARMRFFGVMRQLPRSQLARFTQIDYDREMALVVIERDGAGRETSLGEVRIVADPDHHAADFAIVVRSDCKGRGLGRLLMERIIDYARSRGIAEVRGETLATNERMQTLARQLGFVVRPGTDAGVMDLRLTLAESPK